MIKYLFVIFYLWVVTVFEVRPTKLTALNTAVLSGLPFTWKVYGHASTRHLRLRFSEMSQTC